ncbi:flagellar biosynthetic protein FliQ [Pacificimonas sp. ICDLI1SI03]|jgi:flagellar biosynthetic protein FliQ|tara:strand:+ start:47414 stop:47680 length:267 start_codon:yes stop_codon:yes gene_type:complete
MAPELADLATEMLWVLLFVMAPIILPALLVGLLLGMVQAATSINEMTLSFVPKIIVVVICFAIFGGAMLTLLSDFTLSVFETIPLLSR